MSPPFYSEVLFLYQRSYDVKQNLKSITAEGRKEDVLIPSRPDVGLHLLQIYNTVERMTSIASGGLS